MKKQAMKNNHPMHRSNRNTVSLLLALVALAITGPASAQKKWTLEECVMYAIENNITVEQFELDLERASIDKSDALGNFLPSINGSASARESSGLILDPQTQTNTFGEILSGSFAVNAGYTVFDGFRNFHRANRAKLNTIANQYRLDDLKDDIRLSVANAYLQVISNKEALKVAEAQYEVTRNDLERVRQLVNEGAAPRGDLLEVEATAANQLQSITNAESLVLISRINLAQLLQITDYENFELADETFGVPASDILKNTPKVIFAKALTFRNDIKFSETSVEVAEKDLQIARGSYYPSLTAFFSYNTFATDAFQIGPNPNENPADPTDDFIVFRPDFVAQLENNDGISYGFSLNVPIFNGNSARNNVKRAKIGVLQSKLQLEQTKLDLENAINQAYVDVQTFYLAYEAALKTLDARRTALEYARERYTVGLMNAFDYGQAQARLDNAEATVIRTKYDYIFRLKILEFYFGLPIVLD